MNFRNCFFWITVLILSNTLVLMYYFQDKIIRLRMLSSTSISISKEGVKWGNVDQQAVIEELEKMWQEKLIEDLFRGTPSPPVVVVREDQGEEESSNRKHTISPPVRDYTTVVSSFDDQQADKNYKQRAHHGVTLSIEKIEASLKEKQSETRYLVAENQESIAKDQVAQNKLVATEPVQPKTIDTEESHVTEVEYSESPITLKEEETHRTEAAEQEEEEEETHRTEAAVQQYDNDDFQTEAAVQQYNNDDFQTMPQTAVTTEKPASQNENTKEIIRDNPGRVPDNGPDEVPGKEPVQIPERAPVKELVKNPERASVKEPVKNPERAPVKEPVKNPQRAPVKEPVMIPERAPAKEPVNIPERAPVKEPVKNPERASVKEPVKNPERAPVEEQVKIPERAPAKEPVDIPERAPVKEPVKNPERASAKEPVNAPDKVPKKVPGQDPQPASRFPEKPKMALVMTGSRHGSTWLMDMLAYRENAVPVFEPLNSHPFLMMYAQSEEIRNETLQKGYDPVKYADWREVYLARICICDWHNGKIPMTKGDNHYQSIMGLGWKAKRLGSDYRVTFKESMAKCFEENSMMVPKTIRYYNMSNLHKIIDFGCNDFKVIHLVRDPRAVLTSRMSVFHELYDGNKYLGAHIKDKAGQYGFSEAYMTEAADWMCSHHLHNYKLGMNPPPWLKGKYKMVRYEDLSEFPQNSARDLLHFIGVRYTQQYKDYVYNITHVKDRGVKDGGYYGVERQSIEMLDKWKEKLIEPHWRTIEKVCADMMKAFNYTPTYFNPENEL